METQNDTLRLVLVMVADRAGVAVQHLAQVAVDRLKAASVDGRLSPQDAAAALRAAALEVWAGLGKQARDLLLSEYGSFDTVMKQLIEPTVEAKVREAKVTTPISEPPVTEGMVLTELQIARSRLMDMAGR